MSPAVPTRHRMPQRPIERAAMIAKAEAYFASPDPIIPVIPSVIPFGVAVARKDSFDVLTTIQWETDRAKKEIFAALPLEPNGWRFNESILVFLRCDPRGSVWRLSKIDQSDIRPALACRTSGASGVSVPPRHGVSAGNQFDEASP